MVKFLQLNINKSPRALDLVFALQRESGADVLLLSEIPDRSEFRGAYKDELGDVAVAVASGGPRVTAWGAGAGFVWVVIGGTTVYSAYISPNSGELEYTRFLEELAVSVRSQGRRVIVTGDFNAKAGEWGSPRTDARGEMLRDWAAELNILVVNSGAHTFSRRGVVSHLDLTFASQALAAEVRGWEVMEAETLSDHRCITFQMGGDSAGGIRPRAALGEATIANLQRELRGVNQTSDPRVLVEALRRACGSKNEGSRRHNSVYWWSEEVACARRACIRARRVAQRKGSG